MNEMKMIEEKRALREARKLAEKIEKEIRLDNQRLRLETQRLRRELRAANRGNQRLSLAIKAGRALAEAQAKVERMEARTERADNGERIGIDLVDYHYRVVLTSPGGLRAYRGPEGVWSSGWASGSIISTGLENMHIAEDEARRQSALRGIPCVGECDPPGIVCSTRNFIGTERNNAKTS